MKTFRTAIAITVKTKLVNGEKGAGEILVLLIQCSSSTGVEKTTNDLSLSLKYSNQFQSGTHGSNGTGHGSKHGEEKELEM